ncbi:MAG: Asp-tRNA(Asn)/Glu-tRNA(Gln) amidotransferase subunit GatC [Halarsenatibacteraceae bacterium]
MLSKEEVRHLANLSNLELSEAESEEFTKQIGETLEYIGKIMDVDTEGVAPTYHPLENTNVLREDEVTNSDDRDNLLAEAPDKIDNQFRVPGRK